MQRFIVALFLCAALVSGSVWSLWVVEYTTEEIAQTIESGQLQQAYAQWKDAQLLLGSLLLHDEIDQAERLFQRVLTAEYIESTTDYRIDCSELLTQLHHLPDLQRPSLKNLF